MARCKAGCAINKTTNLCRLCNEPSRNLMGHDFLFGGGSYYLCQNGCGYGVGAAVIANPMLAGLKPCGAITSIPAQALPPPQPSAAPPPKAHSWHSKNFTCVNCGISASAVFQMAQSGQKVPCPGPQPAAAPPPKAHTWSVGSTLCQVCGDNYPPFLPDCPGPGPQPAATAPPTRAAIAQNLMAGGMMTAQQYANHMAWYGLSFPPILDPEPLTPVSAPEPDPARCPVCSIELCPVIDEFAGVLGPKCATCRRN